MDLCFCYDGALLVLNKDRGDERGEIVPDVIPVAVQTGIHSRQAKCRRRPSGNSRMRNTERRYLSAGTMFAANCNGSRLTGVAGMTMERSDSRHSPSFLCLAQESIPEDEQHTLRHQRKREAAGMDFCDKHRGDDGERWRNQNSVIVSKGEDDK